MLDFLFAILSITGATLIPTYIALYLICNLKFVDTKYIAALGLGLTLWYFIDTFTDATELDNNASLLYGGVSFGGWYHISLIAIFILGIIVLAAFDHYTAIRPRITNTQETKVPSTVSANFALIALIPIAIAAVMGVHTLGEGYEFGGGAVSIATSGNSLSGLASAFSPGIPFPSAYIPLASYPIHKFLEACIVACVYVAFIQRNLNVSKSNWHLPVLGLLFGLTALVGTAIGYFVALDPTFFFAFGVTAALYAAIRLGEAIVKSEGREGVIPSYLGGKVFLSLSIGFFLLYFAALLH